ncbi:MAG: FtsX-like permease family protein [Thermorudis peleae]|nr:FtsX-like permease family protein [Thermorudis peleae]
MVSLALKKAWRDFRARPLRSLLTAIGITLGVSVLIAVLVTGRLLVEAQRATYAQTYQPDITAYAYPATPALLSVLARRENVAGVESRAVQFTRLIVGSRRLYAQLTGVDDFSHMQLDVPTLITGRWPEHGEVVVDITARALISLHLGDLIALQPTPGDPITYARVVGFVRAPATLAASIGNQIILYAPARDVRANLGIASDNTLLIRTVQPSLAGTTAQELQRFVARRGISTGGWTVRDPRELTGSRELQTLLALLRAFSLLALGISVFLVANTIAAILLEERHVLGVLKAIGASHHAIAIMVLVQAALFGLLGAIAGLGSGILLGRAITGYLANLAGLLLPAYHFQIVDGALALAAGIGVSLLAAALPCWQALRTPSALLLRETQQSTGRSLSISTQIRAHERTFFLLVLGARNLFRRLGRATITALIVATATAAFASSQTVSLSIDRTIAGLYDRYRAEGWVLFGQLVPTSFATQLERTDPDILHAEAWERTSGAIGSVATDIWGVPAETTIYQPHLVAGTWLRPALPMAAVLTQNLAQRVGAQVGSVVRLDMDRQSVLVQVVGIVDDDSTYLGATTVGKVFLRANDLERLQGHGGRARLFGLQLLSSAPHAVDTALEGLEQQYRSLRPITLAIYQDQEVAKQVIAILALLLRAMVLIVLVIGIAGIANTLLLNLTERRREVGILRALGASTGQLLLLITGEGLGMGIIGLTLGLAASYPIAQALIAQAGERLFRIHLALSFATPLLACALTLIAAALASIGPGFVAARLRPVEVLRYE